MKYILLALSILLNTLVISAQNWNIGIEAGFVHNRMAVDRYNSDPQVGGYIAFATGGHSLDSGIDRWGQEYTTRSHIFDFTNENRDWGCQHGCKRLDGGFVFSMTGYYKHFGLRLGYDLGMTPVSVYGNGKHRTLYASVTYWLKKY